MSPDRSSVIGSASQVLERDKPVLELQGVPDASDAHPLLIVFDAVVRPIPEEQDVGVSDQQDMEVLVSGLHVQAPYDDVDDPYH